MPPAGPAERQRAGRVLPRWGRNSPLTGFKESLTFKAMKDSLLTKPFNYTYSNLTFVLIGMNILVYFFGQIFPKSQVYLAMVPALVVTRYTFWQFFTYMFVHGGFTHILFNMLGLFFFGAAVERRMGSKEFLLFYGLTGTLAGIFSFLVYYFTGAYYVVLVGASGAVYAVLLAYATYYPESRIYIFGILPIRAPVLVIAYTVIAVFSQFSGRGGNVAHLTHLAGFGFAFLYFLLRLRINPIDSFSGNSGNSRNPWR